MSKDKTPRVYVDPENPRDMFEDSKLVGKIISVKYHHSKPQDYLVIGKSPEDIGSGLQMAAVIRWNPINPTEIESYTVEYNFNEPRPLHFCLAESVSEGEPNFENYKNNLDSIV